MISKHNASVILRVFGRLEQQIMRALYEGRHEDMCAISRILGAAQYNALETSFFTELEAEC